MSRQRRKGSRPLKNFELQSYYKKEKLLFLVQPLSNKKAPADNRLALFVAMI
jgi:hypothetical protein